MYQAHLSCKLADSKAPLYHASLCLQTTTALLSQWFGLSADYEGIGYAMADLARLYQGQQAASRTDSRLGLALAALRFTGTLPQGPVPGTVIFLGTALLIHY